MHWELLGKAMKLLFPEEGMYMKKYGFRKLNNGWRFKIGGTSREAFGITLRYFNKCGFRLLINFNTDFLINLFGFNQKIIGV